MVKKKTIEADISTEEKIKEAARKIFTQKGFAASRTRDIAEEAGINLALLNYYFRSKQKLFEVVMMEKMQQFFGTLIPIINNKETSIDSKIDLIVSSYLDMLTLNPDLPIFVLSEISNNTIKLTDYFSAEVDLKTIEFFKQLKAKRPDLNPIHFLLNILGLCVFPFIAKYVFNSFGVLDSEGFKTLIDERRLLVPMWVKAMIAAKP